MTFQSLLFLYEFFLSLKIRRSYSQRRFKISFSGFNSLASKIYTMGVYRVIVENEGGRGGKEEHGKYVRKFLTRRPLASYSMHFVPPHPPRSRPPGLFFQAYREEI